MFYAALAMRVSFFYVHMRMRATLLPPPLMYEGVLCVCLRSFAAIMFYIVVVY